MKRHVYLTDADSTTLDVGTGCLAAVGIALTQQMLQQHQLHTPEMPGQAVLSDYRKPSRHPIPIICLTV